MKRYLTRSSYEAFSKCQRLGYYRFMKDGTGYEPLRPARALLMGLVVHKGLEEVIKGSEVPVEEILRTELADREMSEEDFQLACGLVMAWERMRLPWWKEYYEFVSVEEELEVELSPELTLLARADLVAREKSTGLLYVVNWKTTSSKKDWSLRWRYDIQAMTEALAVQEARGENVVGCLYEGLFKGSVGAGGISTSPLVTGYRCGDVYSSSRHGTGSSQWERIQPWRDFPGGTAGWVGFLDDSTLDELFCHSTPVLKNDDRVRGWIRQLLARESANRHMLQADVPEEDREVYFYQNPSAECRWCDFAGPCWEGVALDQEGLFRLRVDHHTVKETEK